MLLQLFSGPRAVQQECSAVYQLLNHVELGDVGRIVACNKVCSVNQVSGFDRFLTKTQMRHCYTAGLLGIIIEVSLCVHVCVVADDLDGVLVCSYGTISSKSPELAVYRSFRCGNKRLAYRQRQIGYIIDDIDGESLLCLVVVYSNDLLRSGILGSKSVTSAKDLDSVELASAECFNNIQEQRLANGTRLLCTVKYGNLLYRIRDCVNQCLSGERSVQTYLYNTNLAALSHQVIDGLLDTVAYRTHSYDNLICIRSAIVVEQLVVCSDLGIYHIHVLLNDSGHFIIEAVACLTGLEEDIRILGGSHFLRVLRVQSVCLELLQSLDIDHVSQILIIPGLNLLKLVGCTESIKEVDEWKMSGDSCCMSDRRQIHNLLYRRFAEHSSAGLAACIYV